MVVSLDFHIPQLWNANKVNTIIAAIFADKYPGGTDAVVEVDAPVLFGGRLRTYCNGETNVKAYLCYENFTHFLMFAHTIDTASGNL